MSRFASLVILFGFIVLALVLGVVFRYPLVLDDPFVTYRYAQNLLQGDGLVFNAGERVLSTTTPLYAIILAAGGFVYRDLPAMGYWLSVLSMGVAAWLLYALGEASAPSDTHPGARSPARAGGILAGILLLLSPALVLTFGLETGFYLMLGLAALYAYIVQRCTLAFAFAALFTLTRTDGIILTAILAAHYLYAHRSAFREWRSAIRDRQLLRPFLVYLLLILPWLIFATFYFSSPFPFTLAAKLAQAQSGLWDAFAVGFAKWLSQSSTWVLPLLLAASIGAVWAARKRALRKRAPLLLVGAWGLGHLLGYILLGVAFYAWYVAPVIPALALFAGVGIAAIADRAAAYAGQSTLVRWGVFIPLAALLIALELNADVGSGVLNPSPKAQAYASAAEWIALNTEPGAAVDALEVGIIGFYDTRRTYDFVGLTDPIRVPYLKSQKFADGVRRRAADYIVAIPPDVWLEQDDWFKNTYHAVQEIRVAGFYDNQPLVIYRRSDMGRPPIETRMVNAAFEKRIELSNVDLYDKEVNRGEILPMRLNLRALDLEPLPAEWKFTIQLVGAENRIVAQSDSFYPARLPEDGMPFADYQGVPVPADAPPGEYELILAMYDIQNRERLSFYAEDGNEVGDFVPLGTITIR